MATTNQQIADALIRHQIGFTRVSEDIRKKILKLLRDSEPGLKRRINARLKKAVAGTTPGPETTKRLQRLLGEIDALLKTTHDKVDDLITKSAMQIAAAEPRWMARTVKEALVVVLQPRIPPLQLLKQLVTNHPVNGRLVKDWIGDFKSGDQKRIKQAINDGVIQSETPAQLARRIFGKLGVRKITRQDATKMARTVLIGIGDAARDEFWRENPFVSWEAWHATLDDNTCPQCGLLDGKRFKIHEGPRPPIHMQCRCVRVPAIDPELIGQRPRVSATEKDLLREFATARGIPTPKSRAGLPHGSKGAYDAFARKRVRELTGILPASTKYKDFLARQTKAFQEEHLGVIRAKLFREGKLEYEKFFAGDGKLMSIDELMRAEPAAFRTNQQAPPSMAAAA